MVIEPSTNQQMMPSPNMISASRCCPVSAAPAEAIRPPATDYLYVDDVFNGTWTSGDSAVCVVCAPTHVEVHLLCCLDRHANQYPCVGRKRECNASQIVDSHFRGSGDRCATSTMSTARSPTTWQPNIL
jgi:hypothetical protein